MSQGGGGLGILPQKIFGLNGVILHKINIWKCTSMKARNVLMTIWEKGLGSD